MINIGITGIIGSGKTMLSNVFRSCDVPVYDADKKAQVLMNTNPQIISALITQFGADTYKDGVLNKDFMRKVVFDCEQSRLLVNSIVHPVVIQDYINWRNALKCDISAIESAILFEAKIDNLLDYTVFVEADRSDLAERICKRDNVSVEVAESKIALQMANSCREKCSFVVTNDRHHSLIEQALSIIKTIKS